jgi:hypothetical protein
MLRRPRAIIMPNRMPKKMEVAREKLKETIDKGRR